MMAAGWQLVTAASNDFIIFPVTRHQSRRLLTGKKKKKKSDKEALFLVLLARLEATFMLSLKFTRKTRRDFHDGEEEKKRFFFLFTHTILKRKKKYCRTT